jgi:Protein of unknown function (DUF4446)
MIAALSGTNGALAAAAAGAAALALLACAALALALRRVRSAQRALLGDRGGEDLVEHAAGMQRAFEDLRRHVDAQTQHTDGRLAGVETAQRGSIAHRALVRYDAYNELSGHQSVSIALLDDDRSGIVLSCIHHRDQARVYAKAVVAGQGELELSPEEAEAVARALAPAPAGGPVEHSA